ncbi:MAG: hypothetical protein U0V73_13850 [Acidimicrobiia bacterium]
MSMKHTARVLAALLFVSLLGVGVVKTLTANETAPAGGATLAQRDLAWWPFSASSPWNTSIGSGAVFSDDGDARTNDLHQNPGNVNAGSWSHPVYVASDADPLRQVHTPDGTVTLHIPANAAPDAEADGHMHVITPDHHYVDEMYIAQPDGSGGFSAAALVRNDLTGPGVGAGGTRAYGGSAIGGLIRTWELQQGSVHHALAFAASSAQMQAGPVWPATAQDGDGGSSYSGSLPMGTLAAIPGSVDVNSLGLSPTGLAIAHALQDYGAYLVDQSSAFTLYAEGAAEGMPQLEDLRNDLRTVQGQLRAVVNNGPNSVGGGGTPRVAPAPAPGAAAPAAAPSAPVTASVAGFGGVSAYGADGGVKFNAPVVGIAATRDGSGFWLAGADGGVFAYGSSRFAGSAVGSALRAPIVGIAATPSGNGYWLAGADGGVFSYGDAVYYGSMATTRLVAPVVGIVASPSGKGYRLVAADGGVFAYGDVKFLGAPSTQKLVAPVTGMTSTPLGGGYWLVAADGGVFAYGEAKYGGSPNGLHPASPIRGISATASGDGYWLLGADGGVFAYGDAVFRGALDGVRAPAHAVAIASAPSGGYWIVRS